MAMVDLQEQFQILVEEHKKILYKVCNSYCRDRDSRDDLAQEIMIQLWNEPALKCLKVVLNGL